MVVLAVLGMLALVPALAQARFDVGLEDLGHFQPATAARAFGAMRAIDGSTIRLGVPWSGVAPGGATKPTGFVATNPADPGYNWDDFDRAVRAAAQRHLNVLMTLFSAPAWAEGPNRPANPNISAGAWDPSPSAFADFARAAALRYSGRFPDPLHRGASLPRVRDWEIWNEQNLPYYLAAPDLVGEYRNLLNAGYSAIKAVHADNTVATGGLAPVSFLPPLSLSPLKFAADLMCLRRVGTGFVRNGSCPDRAHFDAFGHHPYTLAATPTKPAYRYDDVLVADIGKIRDVVGAADRLHTVAPSIRHQLWVTEWGWVTNPPNKTVGESYATAARYVAYAMYEMWRSGVSLVMWQTIRDVSNANPLGGGLYKGSGQPKPSLQAFGFPVVAAVSRGRGFVWGRAPVSGRVHMIVERRAGRRWQQVTTTLTGSDGVFEVHFKAGGNATYRARVAHGPTSLAYDSTPIPPRRTHLFNSG